MQCDTSWGLNSEELWVWLIHLMISNIQRNIYELAACPRAEQIPCICFKLLGHWPCLEVVCLWYVSGIISLSMHLSSCMGIFGLVLVMSYHNQECYLIQKYCFGFILWKWWFNTKIFGWWSSFVDMVLLKLPFTSCIEKCGQQPLYVL